MQAPPRRRDLERGCARPVLAILVAASDCTLAFSVTHCSRVSALARQGASSASGRARHGDERLESFAEAASPSSTARLARRRSSPIARPADRLAHAEQTAVAHPSRSACRSGVSHRSNASARLAGSLAWLEAGLHIVCAERSSLYWRLKPWLGLPDAISRPCSSLIIRELEQRNVSDATGRSTGIERIACTAFTSARSIAAATSIRLASIAQSERAAVSARPAESG